MLKGKVVRIRFRKDQPYQPTWVFLGKVVHFDQEWTAVEGRGVLVFTREALPQEARMIRGKEMITLPKSQGGLTPVEVDAEIRILWFPRETIASIRVLPDDFDLNDIRVVGRGRRLDIVVKGAPDASIDERFED